MSLVTYQETEERVERKVTPYREVVGEKLRLNFHLGQAKAWDSRARFPVILGGTQLGKTCFAPDWLEREIRMKGLGEAAALLGLLGYPDIGFWISGYWVIWAFLIT